MKSFNLNGKTVIARDLGFGEICDLQEMGVDLLDVANIKGMVAVRGYVAICLGVDKDTAGAEIEKHIVANGFDIIQEISEAMMSKLEESDFFRKIIEAATEKAAQSQSEETTETEKKTSRKKA